MEAEKVEYTSCINGRFSKRDLWGADIEWRCREAHGLIQVKTSGTSDSIGKGKRQLKQDGNWPHCYQRHVSYWPNRTERPEFHRVDDGMDEEVWEYEWRTKQHGKRTV